MKLVYVYVCTDLVVLSYQSAQCVYAHQTNNKGRVVIQKEVSDVMQYYYTCFVFLSAYSGTLTIKPVTNPQDPQFPILACEFSLIRTRFTIGIVKFCEGE